MITIGQHRRHTGRSNRGEASLPPGDTTVQITHGLLHAPMIVICNPALDVGDTFITLVDYATFTFNCDTAAADWCAIYWYVE